MIHTLLTITGPSLSGKTTLENQLVSKYKLDKITSFTTRPIRAGEVSGEHYYFLERQLAEQKIADGEMAEHVEFHGNYYGILGSELEAKTASNSCIAVVEPRGLKQLAIYCRDHDIGHISVFLTNSPTTLAARFLQRFKDDPDSNPINLASRLVNLLTHEQSWLHEFDYDIIIPRFDKGNEKYIVDDVYCGLGIR